MENPRVEECVVEACKGRAPFYMQQEVCLLIRVPGSSIKTLTQGEVGVYVSTRWKPVSPLIRKPLLRDVLEIPSWQAIFQALITWKTLLIGSIYPHRQRTMDKYLHVRVS